MTFYWSARQVPQLRPFKATERAEIVQLAHQKMPIGRRYLSGAIKLLVLIALFWQLISVQSWAWRIAALLAAGLLYPLLLSPLSLNFARPYLDEAITEFRANQTATPPTPSHDEQS
ncbi:DUF6170 family protein [Aliidiomarina sp. Khilg15.8]